MATGVGGDIIGEVSRILSRLGDGQIYVTPDHKHITSLHHSMRKIDMSKQNKIAQQSSSSRKRLTRLEQIDWDAAGIDIGSKSHFVAVPSDRDDVHVREFGCFTQDLYTLADWLKQCKIKTVAMESTGVYWIPLFTILEERGFEVRLVNARHVKNVSGRKTDVLDCQWLQELHAYGLLEGSFRPEEQVCQLRSYMRQRARLIECASSHILHMQKALSQMNLLLHNVISDIAGKTGMLILEAIVAGQRDPQQLANYRDPRCRSSKETIEKSLTGHYRPEHVFELSQALELYKIYQEKIVCCDEAIEAILRRWNPLVSPTLKALGKDKSKRSNEKIRKSKRSKNELRFEVKPYLEQMTGVDLTRIPGIDSHTALKVIAEIGFDMNRFENAKHFASWLGLCPGSKISGGKRLSSRSKPCANRAATALRMAASTLYRSPTALGAFLRRMKTRLGPAKAITATAHKLAKLIYNLLKYGSDYVEIGQEYYEKEYQNRVIKNLRKRAEILGFELIKKQPILLT